MSNYALHVPESLLAYVRQVAEEEHVSVNDPAVNGGACDSSIKFRPQQAD